MIWPRNWPRRSSRNRARSIDGSTARFPAPNGSGTRPGAVDVTHDLSAGHGVRLIEPAGGAGDADCAGLADAADCHARVLGLEHDQDPARGQLFLDQVGNFLGEAFLNLWLPGQDIDGAGELAQAD